jgi:hypothetical protein
MGPTKKREPIVGFYSPTNRGRARMQVGKRYLLNCTHSPVAKRWRGHGTSLLPEEARRSARALLELAKNLGEDAGAGLIVIRHKIGQDDLAAMAGGCA